MKRFLLQVLALLVLPFAVCAAELGITPVAVNMNAETTRTSVSVVNYGREAVTMQADVIGWTRVDGVDQDSQTSDVMVNPAVFTVQPGQTQIVRLGLKKRADTQTEATYRLVLREIPTALSNTAAPAPNVRVLVAMRVPIYVAPASVARKEEWSAKSDGKTVHATVRNAGNVHYRLGRVNLRLSGSREGAPDAEANVSALLLPGEERSFPLQLAQASGPKQAMLEIFTDKGVEYVELDIAKN